MVNLRSLRGHRRRCFREQKERCFYCDSLMYESSYHGNFKKFYRKTFPNAPLSRDQQKSLREQIRCTLEHLHCSSNNSRSIRSNFVAACNSCNSKRQGICVYQHIENKGRKVDLQKEYQWCSKIMTYKPDTLVYFSDRSLTRQSYLKIFKENLLSMEKGII